MMHTVASFPLWAVHISDAFLTPSWLLGGIVLAALLGGGALVMDAVLAWVKQRELREEEIAQLALFTSAFFVASQIHLRVGPTTVHLLLNGLLGIVLRWRAALAIPVGLYLQFILFGHGGLYTVGINSCIMVIPALLAWGMFAGLHRLPCLTKPWFRGLLVWISITVCMICFVYSITLIATNNLLDLDDIDPQQANEITFHPVTLLLAMLPGIFVAWLEPRLENAPEFPLGLLIGIVTVLLTMLLNALVLIYGGSENFRSVVLVTFVAHMPIALIEGFVLGGIVGFLVKVRPSLLGWRRSDL